LYYCAFASAGIDQRGSEAIDGAEHGAAEVGNGH
jgi:hypothetical protein